MLGFTTAEISASNEQWRKLADHSQDIILVSGLELTEIPMILAPRMHHGRSIQSSSHKYT